MAIGAGLASLAVGGAMTLTLMACYGLPPCDAADDRDGDGFCRFEDCNESDAKVHVGADDPAGDGIDQNCDGVDGIAQQDAGSDAPECLTCAQGSGILGTTQSELCPGPALTSFQALLDCACTTQCQAVCQDNWCQAGALSPDCQTCIDMQCATQKLDCQEN